MISDMLRRMIETLTALERRVTHLERREPARAQTLTIDQYATTAAIPVLHLIQADVSEEFIRLEGTVATGNSLEAVGAKTLTTTHFAKIYIEGVGVRYIALGTIA
jgi:hypothetical protein